jgi:hypothetical protein
MQKTDRYDGESHEDNKRVVDEMYVSNVYSLYNVYLLN